MSLWVIGKSGHGRSGDFEVLRDGAAGDAHGADEGAGRAFQWDSTCERRKSTIAELESVGRSARLAVFPNGLAVAFEQGGGSGFLDCDVYRAEYGAVHSAESFQVGGRIQNRDDDGHAQFGGFGLAGVDHCSRLTRSEWHS